MQLVFNVLMGLRVETEGDVNGSSLFGDITLRNSGDLEE